MHIKEYKIWKTDDTAVNNQLNMSRRTTNKWDKSQTTAQFCLGRSSSGSIPGILPNTVDKVKTQDGEQTLLGHPESKKNLVHVSQVGPQMSAHLQALIVVIQIKSVLRGPIYCRHYSIQ